MNTIVRSWRRNRRASGNRLRALRERAGLTQLALSAASGITNDSICRLELGRRSPQAATIERLAKALDVEPLRFVTDEPPEEDWSTEDETEVVGSGVAAARR